MNKIKLTILASKNKNLKYNIFRSIGDDTIPNDIDTLSKLMPDIIVDESKSTHITISHKTNLLCDVSYNDDIYYKYFLNYDFKYNSTLPLSIIIEFNDNMQLIKHETINLKCYFDNNNNITKLEIVNRDKSIDTILNPIEIYNIIKINKNNIYINKNLLNGSTDVKIDTFVEVIEIYDSHDNLNGIEAIDNEIIHGLNKPEFDIKILFYQVATNSFIPYYEIKQNNLSKGIVYYYKIIAVDPIGMVSNISNTTVQLLSQKSENILSKIKFAKNINYDIQNTELKFDNVINNVKSSEPIYLGRPNASLYNRGPIVNINVPVFNNDEIRINSNYLISDNKLILNIPNIWHYEDQYYKYRYSNVYKIVNYLKDNVNITSEYSDLIGYETKLEIPIEKMIVLKRNVTNDTYDYYRPSTLDDTDIIIMKQYIRKDGIYYIEEEHSQKPYNVPFSNDIIDIINNNSVFKEFVIEDTECMQNQIYNYTIYLYDIFGNISEPIVKVINTFDF